MDTLEYLNELLSEGEEVLNTKYDPNGGGDGFVVMGFRVTVDEIKFAKWQSKSIAFLEQILGTDDFRLKKFKEEVRNNFYDHVQIGIGILESIIEDIDRNNFKTEISKRNTELEPFLHIEAILNNFHEHFPYHLKYFQQYSKLLINLLHTYIHRNYNRNGEF